MAEKTRNSRAGDITTMDFLTRGGQSVFVDSASELEATDLDGSDRTDAYAPTDAKARQAFWILLAAIALTALEGATRKWVIGPGFQMASYAAYFSKDIVFALLILLPARGEVSPASEIFVRWLVPSCFLLVCGSLISATQEINAAGALLTLRAVLLLPTIAFLVVRRLHGISLRSVAWFIGFLTILNFFLGVLQNRLPADHLLNRYAADTLEITKTISGVRATGTFSYISGMGVISVAGIWAGMVYMSMGKTMWQQMFGWIVLASGFGCGLASVSRGPVFNGIIMVLAWLLSSHKWAAKKSGSVIAGIIVLSLVTVFELTATFSLLGQGFLLRTESAGDTTEERSLAPFTDALMAIEMAPFGSGLGTEQVGGNYYSRGEMSFTTFETQFARLVLDTSVLGLMGFLIMCTGAVLALQVAKQHTASSGGNAALFATQLFMVSMFASNVVFNHVASAFVWMIFAGVMASCASRPPHENTPEDP
jgi:hypothetical protein